MPPELPDPRTAATTPFAPAARRTLTAFGAPVELVLLPERAARPGRPGTSRPPFANSIAERILAEETQWRGAGIAVTRNRYPFASQQLIAWSERPTRDPDEPFLAALFGWVDRIDGSALLNSIGAAASIPRAHAHVTPERLPFLHAVAEQPAEGPWLPAVPGATFVQKAVPFCLLGVRGAPAARAAGVGALQLRRMTAAINLVAEGGTVWLYPRSAVETPAPHFPHALGAAEVWGRWCFVDPAAFAAAAAAGLERALQDAGCPPPR